MPVSRRQRYSVLGLGTVNLPFGPERLRQSANQMRRGKADEFAWARDLGTFPVCPELLAVPSNEKVGASCVGAFNEDVVIPVARELNAVEAIGLQWYGWHGFRRGMASNLYALESNEKTVQRILRHAHPHVTKECHIKTFDPSVVEAMERSQATVEVLESVSSNRPAGAYPGTC